MALQSRDVYLRLPKQDLLVLSSGDSDPKKLEEWVDSLPMTNYAESAKKLYFFLTELNRLSILAPEIRLTLTEIIRPAILKVCSGLGIHFMNQPVGLNERGKHIANLSRLLQTYLAISYKLVAVESTCESNDDYSKETTAIALHRAISGLSQTLLDSYMLYNQAPKLIWLEMHQLYSTAECLQLIEIEIEDPNYKYINSSNICDAYTRAILLSTSKPNQLRQSEIESLYFALESWTVLTGINMAFTSGEVFLCNLTEDVPPAFISISQHDNSGQYRFLNAVKLDSLLRTALNSRSTLNPHEFSIPDDISDQMLDHIWRAWSSLEERIFERKNTQGGLSVCFGLSATHYFLSGGHDFDCLLSGSVQKLTASIIPDMEAIADKEQEFDCYNYNLVNSSPRGYCLEWMGDTPAQLKPGEIIGVQHSGEARWNVCVIRWVKLQGSGGVQVGVELLSQDATPCATKVVENSQDVSKYIRSLIIPEIKALCQPATLITPREGFSEKYKVVLNNLGEETQTMLIKQLCATGSYAQFKYQGN